MTETTPYATRPARQVHRPDETEPCSRWAIGTVPVAHGTTESEPGSCRANGTVSVRYRVTGTVRVSHRTTDAEADDRGETVVGSAVRRPLEWTGARS